MRFRYSEEVYIILCFLLCSVFGLWLFRFSGLDIADAVMLLVLFPIFLVLGKFADLFIREILRKMKRENTGGHPALREEDFLSDDEEANRKVRHIIRAIEDEEVMTVFYVNAKEEESVRNIMPQNLYKRNENIYIVAFCYMRMEKRTFRLDRIHLFEK